ncbi:hypothetical protein [Leptolyngbya sp. FACHB-17]|uniref:hypothetical protein n=1 Tax=unclassified Leptolyngbya TaxID=2650499 RepID=UPI0016814122|nr:hypothetical protein [Leptolyngbya sp. FACHB-17]MBD2079579.1 hypothetical protein [Leptolyngbya sp. FACHB-17]
MARLKATVPNLREGVPDEKVLNRYALNDGTFLDLTQCTVFIFKEGRYIAIPEAQISSFRPQEQIDNFYSCPKREELRCAEVD